MLVALRVRFETHPDRARAMHEEHDRGGVEEGSGGGYCGFEVPLAARAQQPSVPVIGFNSGAAAQLVHVVAAFKKGLNELGYVEVRDVAIAGLKINTIGCLRSRPI